MMNGTPTIEEFQSIILNYYYEHGRKFPWRETRNPYEILVSEIMLQQTQTERVIAKYSQWLKRFPLVEDVAKAPLQEILFLWSGLGYNRRARFLHEACKKICIDYKGIFPDTATELKKLPGIGEYTSGAVSCFAFNNPEIFIETNIRSIFIFFFFPHEPFISDKEIFPLIEKTIYRENPRIWYYALMDYGAVLKKKIKNPNRKSAHYTKQSKFEGSLRQARGAVLRQLVKNPDGLDLQHIKVVEKIDYMLLEDAAVKLCSEGLIYQDSDIYRIKNVDTDE